MLPQPVTNEESKFEDEDEVLVIQESQEGSESEENGDIIEIE